MNSGCICCSLVGDFGTALKEVADKYHPDRIMIEPSGVGKLSDVIRAVERNTGEGMVLNSATTVVDVTKCRMYLKNFGEFFKNQVEAAGTIILSRMDTDKAKPETVEEALKLIRELNPSATVITTPVEALGGKKVLSTMEGNKIDLTLVEDDEEEEHHHHEHEEGHHHHGHIITTGIRSTRRNITTTSIMSMKRSAATIMTGMRRAAAAITTIITTMRTRYLQAGVRRRSADIQKRKSSLCWRSFPQMIPTERSFGQREW